MPRPKGVPNRRTLEKLTRENVIEQAAVNIAEEAGIEQGVAHRALVKALDGRKLAKDELEEFLPILKSGVIAFQGVAYRAPPGTPEFDPGAWSRYMDWAQFFVDSLVKLAEFQSPKWRAIGVHVNPQAPGAATAAAAAVADEAANVLEIDDPQAASRVYLRTIQRFG